MWPFTQRTKALQSVDDRGWTQIFDWVTGAWQTHTPYDEGQAVLSNPTVFTCQTLIANDIAKLPAKMQQLSGGIWLDAIQPVSKLLRRPNDFQNTIQFIEAWVHSKLSHGNTYILKVRDERGEVIQLHVLDPLKVEPLVADSGDVYYRLNEDRLSKVTDSQMVLSATEIIHDRFNCLYHPLIGLSPIFAAANVALMGLTTQKNLRNFFANNANPGGILTAPGPIGTETAKRLADYWKTNFTGDKVGGVAIAGDGLEFKPMRMSNVDAQVIELMGWGDAKICAVYHVPAYMAGVGELPKFDNIEALTQAYYSQCLQILIESFEQLLDFGLGVEEGYRVQLDVDVGLFRMDTATLIKTLGDGAKAGLYAPDEARKKLNLAAVPGGKYPYLQQQNYSLEALSRRDADGLIAPAKEPDYAQALAMFDTMVKNISPH